MLNDSLIDHSPQTPGLSHGSSQYQEVLPVYEYAALCSTVIPQLYESDQSSSQATERTSTLYASSVAWKDRSMNFIHQSFIGLSAGTRTSSSLEDSVQIRYYEILFTIQGRWHIPGWRTAQLDLTTLSKIRDSVIDAIRNMERMWSRDANYDTFTSR